MVVTVERGSGGTADAIQLVFNEADGCSQLQLAEINKSRASLAGFLVQRRRACLAAAYDHKQYIRYKHEILPFPFWVLGAQPSVTIKQT